MEGGCCRGKSWRATQTEAFLGMKKHSAVCVPTLRSCKRSHRPGVFEPMVWIRGSTQAAMPLGITVTVAVTTPPFKELHRRNQRLQWPRGTREAWKPALFWPLVFLLGKPWGRIPGWKLPTPQKQLRWGGASAVRWHTGLGCAKYFPASMTLCSSCKQRGHWMAATSSTAMTASDLEMENRRKNQWINMFGKETAGWFGAFVR